MEATSGREIAVIEVGGMVCQNCAKHVTEALRQVAGVQSVDVNLDKKQAQVIYESAQASVAQLMEAVNSAGYDAQGVTRGKV
jgi:copper chaperone CopZ